MEASTMSTSLNTGMLIAYGRYALLRWGWAAFASVGLLLAALAVHYLGVVVPTAEMARLRSAQAADFAKRQSAALAPDPKAMEAQRALNFESSLPDAAQALQSLEFIHRAAARHGVALPSAQYQATQTSRDAAGAFKKYAMVMPVQTSYPALRAWLAEILNSQPALSLDDLSLQRSSSDTDVLEARVRLTLFVAER